MVSPQSFLERITQKSRNYRQNPEVKNNMDELSGSFCLYPAISPYGTRDRCNNYRLLQGESVNVKVKV